MQLTVPALKQFEKNIYINCGKVGERHGMKK